MYSVRIINCTVIRKFDVEFETLIIFYYLFYFIYLLYYFIFIYLFKLNTEVFSLI